MSDGALFDDVGLRVAPDPTVALSADRRRTARQAEQVAAGIHPLLAAIRAPYTDLHPRAPRDATRTDRRRPYTCGACLHLAAQSGTAGSYLKCAFGEGERVTRGPGTDVRAWWPACPDYLGAR